MSTSSGSSRNPRQKRPHLADIEKYPTRYVTPGGARYVYTQPTSIKAPVSFPSWGRSGAPQVVQETVQPFYTR